VQYILTFVVLVTLIGIQTGPMLKPFHATVFKIKMNAMLVVVVGAVVVVGLEGSIVCVSQISLRKSVVAIVCGEAVQEV